MNQSRDIAIQCLRDEAGAILGLIPQLDEHFDQAIELLFACKGKVIVTGVGKSGHVGAKIAATLSSTGTPAFFLNPLDAFHGDLGVITASDVVVAISNSGQTDELLRIIPFLTEHHIPFVGISGSADSLLARHATEHITISVQQEACPLNLAPTSSTTAQLALGDAIACALMERRQFKAHDFAQFHPGGSLGKRLLSTARDVMRTDDLPVIDPDMMLSDAMYWVSRGKMGMAVAMKDDKVAGIITDGDVRRAMQTMGEDIFKVPVSQVMTRTPKCVMADTKITKIQDLMNQHKFHAVLVVDQSKHLLGIVDSLSCMI